MRKYLLFVLALSLLAAVGAGADPGTANVPSAVAWQGPTMWQAEARLYRGGNNTLALGAVTRLAERTDLTVWYTHLNGDSHGDIAGALRESLWSGLSLELKQELKDEGARTKIALLPALEWCWRQPKGTNAATGASAKMKRMVPSLAVPVQWPLREGSVVLCPRVIFFDRNLPDSTGGTTRGFGTMFSLGAGVRYPAGRGTFIGDLARPFSGDNAVDEDTGIVARKTVWSAGWETPLGSGGDTVVSVYATNAAGPSLATSMIGTPGNGVGLGVRLGHTF